MTDNKVLIKVENLKKHYTGGSVKALDGINCEIKKGEVVVIVGPSGSGKSTLLRSLNLLEIPTSGKIYFDGTDITDKKTNINTHRQRMGMVFQHFNLFPNMNVLKNMTKDSEIIVILREHDRDAGGVANWHVNCRLDTSWSSSNWECIIIELLRWNNNWILEELSNLLNGASCNVETIHVRLQ